MTSLNQKREALKAKRDEVAIVHEAATPEGSDTLDHTAAGLSKIAGRSFDSGTQLAEYINAGYDEIDKLFKEEQALSRLDTSAKANKVAMDVAGEGIKHAPAGDQKDGDEFGLKGYTSQDVADFKGRTVGEAIVREMMVKSGNDISNLKNRGDLGVDLPVKMLEGMTTKTDMTTTAGWDPEDIRIDRFVFSAQRPAPKVVDIFPTFATDMSTVLYMEETTYTSGAAEVAENAAIAEATFVWTERSDEVRKIAHTLPVTDEQLDDVPGLRAIIDQRLGFGIAQRLDLQILVGNGTAPNISGIHDRSGIGTRTKGTDSVIVAIHKALTDVQIVGFADPNFVVIHPTDWQTVRLSQTSDGAFLFGPPSVAVTPQLWGLPVLVTTAQTVTQALVGDFANFTALFMRRGITVTVTDSHASEFLDDILRIKASIRVALAVFRAAAFSEVTAI